MNKENSQRGAGEILLIFFVVGALLILVMLLMNKKDPKTKPVEVNLAEVVVADPESGRFTVRKVSTFNDHSIYILTDTKTGKEYVGVRGIGISELGSHLEGKISAQDER